MNDHEPAWNAEAEAEAEAGRLVSLARELGLRLAVAESLTGGLLAATIVSVPGASHAFSGGIVSYDTELKRSLLGVDSTLLAERGPVDAEVARQMARGVREACAVGGSAADVGISTTGVAGPDPDAQTGQPVGTVWVGVSTVADEQAFPLRGLRDFDRASIRRETVRQALILARETLAKENLSRVHSHSVNPQEYSS